MVWENTMKRALVLVLLALLAGCGTASSSATMGAPRAARAENCDLTLVAWQDVQPGGKYASYELVGMIHVRASAGAQATDEDVKKEVRPKACALGGELVAPAMSHGARNKLGMEVAQSLGFVVYAKKTSTAPQKY
jgi:hypothetical protein